jgi:S1-C subfamily serine protease
LASLSAKVTDMGFGAGVIIEPSGYVLTNWHVINGYEAGVIFFKPATGATPEKSKAYVVTLVAQDENADLALLKIVKPPAGLPTVQFGDISMVQVAEDIHIIGHPHGELWSYSTGVISQIRDNYDWKYSDGSKHLAKVLQLQTAINPGNSGGPVLDNTSKMLGLVSMSEEGQNLNYAVAIDVIKSFVARSMALKTRGGGVGSQDDKGEFYVGHTNSGLVVTKAVYPDCESYTTHDQKGSVSAVLVHTASGAILTASEPNAFGGFRDWSYKVPDGGAVVVTSDGLMPELVSAGTRE